MKGQSTWSYHPYRPLLYDVGDIYISRVAPSKDTIHFEWISDNDNFCVYYKKRSSSEFVHFCDTGNCFCDITGLSENTDYAFYVESGNERSRTRLARTSSNVGTVVNYLHPEDDAYAFSGHHLCSPSLLRHPDGYLLASMDVFGRGEPQNLTLIYRSDDGGKTWYYLSELMPCFWGKLFIHKGEVYMLSCSTEYGDLLIGKSSDGGKTFSAPVTLFRGSNGKKGNPGVHKNPQNMVYHGGRLWGSLEWGCWANRKYCHAAMVMSCAEGDDLLVPENWSFTEPLEFTNFVPELNELPSNTMTIEGTLTISPDGRLLDVMRFGKLNTAIVYEVNTDEPEAKLGFSHLMDFSANYSKFMIKRDERSGYYYTVGTRVYNPERTNARDLLSLMRSKDLLSWDVVFNIIDYREVDTDHIGFQYCDFEIEGDDIIFLCRTAFGGAANFHDTNYSTFHRIKDFRSYTKPLNN